VEKLAERRPVAESAFATGRTRKLTLGAAVVARPGEPDPPNALTLANARKRASEALRRSHHPGRVRLGRVRGARRRVALMVGLVLVAAQFSVSAGSRISSRYR
jgi:hypothetical protein